MKSTLINLVFVGASLLSVACIASSASSGMVILSGESANRLSKTNFRVDWVEPQAPDTDSRLPRKGWLQVTLGGTVAPHQVLELEVSLPKKELAFGFVDLDGDGYQDLVFSSDLTGSAGPEVGIRVFRWQPSEQRLVFDGRLSSAGALRPAPQAGCVVAELLCRNRGWVPRTLCLKNMEGPWHDVSPGRCNSFEP